MKTSDIQWFVTYCMEPILKPDTAYDADKWTHGNPWSGHCAVSALVIQDKFGGEIVKAKVDGASHYWNIIEGCHVDPSFEQYLPGTPKPIEHTVVNDKQLRKSIANRYKILTERVNEREQNKTIRNS